MKLDFFAVISNLISLFALIGVGYAAVRTGVLSEKISGAFSALLLKITLPCTIFISLVQRDYDPRFIGDSTVIFVSGLIFFIVSLYLCRYIAIFLGVPKNSRGVWSFACTFSNSGFMGFPIALKLFGGEGLALAVMLNISFNIVIYTLGALELSRDNLDHNAEKINVRSIIFSNINIATVLSLIFYFGQINLPEAVAVPITYLSNITTPLSMIIIGMALTRSNGLEVLTDKYVWECTAMRLIIIPEFLCLLFKFFPLSSNPLVSAVFVVIMGMPVASVTAALCEMYKSNMKFTAEIMFIQNLLCIITIPLICLNI